jgi:hypothetical protein
MIGLTKIIESLQRESSHKNNLPYRFRAHPRIDHESCFEYYGDVKEKKLKNLIPPATPQTPQSSPHPRS